MLFSPSNLPLSKQPFTTQPQIENEDVTWSPRYNVPNRRTNEHRALSLREVELDDWFLILHIVLETCTTWFMRKFSMSFVFHFYILGLTSWIWTNPSTERLKFESASKWSSYEGFNLEHCPTPTPTNVQDWSLQCPSNRFGPSKRNPKLKMKMSLEVLHIISPPQEPTNVGHCHYKKWS